MKMIATQKAVIEGLRAGSRQFVRELTSLAKARG
jgi:hypothetical protein